MKWWEEVSHPLLNTLHEHSLFNQSVFKLNYYQPSCCGLLLLNSPVFTSYLDLVQSLDFQKKLIFFSRLFKLRKFLKHTHTQIWEILKENIKKRRKSSAAAGITIIFNYFSIIQVSLHPLTHLHVRWRVIKCVRHEQEWFLITSSYDKKNI